MRGTRRGAPAPTTTTSVGRATEEDRGYLIHDNEIAVVVSPTGRQRLKPTPPAYPPRAGGRVREEDVGEYSASKYKVYEHPQYASPYDQV
jgi:hypothetical protein